MHSKEDEMAAPRPMVSVQGVDGAAEGQTTLPAVFRCAKVYVHISLLAFEAHAAARGAVAQITAVAVVDGCCSAASRSTLHAAS